MMIHRNRFPGRALRSCLAALAFSLTLALLVHADEPPAPAVSAADPWKAAQIVKPAELAAMLADSTHERPLLLHVGFKMLYRGGAIPGSRYAGPGSRADGIALLKQAVKGVPHERSIVVYCGCCPWDHCPNMRPAFKTLHAMGFKNVRALYVPKNLDADWANKGYPIATKH